jgi:hypothetical protein
MLLLLRNTDAMIDMAQYWVNVKLYEQLLRQAGELR